MLQKLTSSLRYMYGHTIMESPISFPCCKQPILYRSIDDPHNRCFVHHIANGYAELRIPMNKVHGTINGVNNPSRVRC